MDQQVSNVFDSDLSGVAVDGFDDPSAGDAAESTPADVSATGAEDGVTELAESAGPTSAEGEPDHPNKPDAAVPPPAAKPAVKQLKFMADGTEVPVAETAVVDWKVDGKTEKIPIRALLDNYAGKVAYEKRFNEVATQKKAFLEESNAFQAEKAKHTRLIDDMHKNASEGRIFEAVTNMIEMAGGKIDAKEYVSNLRTALIEQAKALAQMTPDQRQLHEMKEEQEYLKSQYARTIQQREQEQAQQAFQTRVTKAMESAKIGADEYVQTRDWLAQRFQAEGKDVAQITPEFVASHSVNVRDYRAVKEAMDAVDPELHKNSGLWDQAVLMLRSNPHWTTEDVKDIFKQAVGEKRSTAVSKKLAASPVATVAKGAVKQKAVPVKNKATDFSQFSEDDLNW